MVCRCDAAAHAHVVVQPVVLVVVLHVENRMKPALPQDNNPRG